MSAVSVPKSKLSKPLSAAISSFQKTKKSNHGSSSTTAKNQSTLMQAISSKSSSVASQGSVGATTTTTTFSSTKIPLKTVQTNVSSVVSSAASVSSVKTSFSKCQQESKSQSNSMTSATSTKPEKNKSIYGDTFASVKSPPKEDASIKTFIESSTSSKTSSDAASLALKQPKLRSSDPSVPEGINNCTTSSPKKNNLESGAHFNLLVQDLNLSNMSDGQFDVVDFVEDGDDGTKPDIVAVTVPEEANEQKISEEKKLIDAEKKKLEAEEERKKLRYRSYKQK